MKASILSPDLFNISSIDYSQYIITVKGKPSSSINPPATYGSLYREINRRIMTIPGLNERILVMILPEYQNPNRNNLMEEKFSGNKFEPIIVVLNKKALPSNNGWIGGTITVASFVASIVTCLVYATDVNTLNSAFLQEALSGMKTYYRLHNV